MSHSKRHNLREVEESIDDSVPKAIKEKMKIDSRENSRSRKRARPNSKSESDKKISKPPRRPLELETDIGILQRRQKQIDYGKNTVGYYNFNQQVPLNQRTKEHPKTPDKYAKYSRRSWDALIKIWRKKLHTYDDSATGGDASDCSELDSDEDSVK